MATRERSGAKVSPVAGRGTYHHGGLRDALVAETLRIIEEAGPDAVSVREVARRAGVSSAAPFRHFPDREALLRAVSDGAAARLREALATEMAIDGASLVGRWRAAGRALGNFAARHPGLFRTLPATFIRTVLRESVAIHQEISVQHTLEALLYGFARLRSDGAGSIEDETALAFGVGRLLEEPPVIEAKRTRSREKKREEVSTEKVLEAPMRSPVETFAVEVVEPAPEPIPVVAPPVIEVLSAPPPVEEVVPKVAIREEESAVDHDERHWAVHEPESEPEVEVPVEPEPESVPFTSEADDDNDEESFDEDRESSDGESDDKDEERGKKKKKKKKDGKKKKKR